MLSKNIYIFQWLAEASQTALIVLQAPVPECIAHNVPR
jgi:hypothetical protein